MVSNRSVILFVGTGPCACPGKEVGIDMKKIAVYLYVVLFFVMAGCALRQERVSELKKFPLDSLDGVITKSGVELDKEISSDGNGSLRISTEKPVVVRLFEVGDLDIENARLIYSARIRTKDVKGQVYLEMWCQFPGIGEAFSRSLQSPLSGTTDWVTEETPFFLKKGENPDNVKLNLVVNGKGTVWIDDICLLKGPLR